MGKKTILDKYIETFGNGEPMNPMDPIERYKQIVNRVEGTNVYPDNSNEDEITSEE